MQLTLRLLLLAPVLFSAAALAGELSPEHQLALQSFRPGEKERLEKAVGAIDELPLYRVELDVDPKNREVTGKVQVQIYAKSETLKELHLRIVEPPKNDPT